MQCSFIDTGTDAVLCTDECNIDQLSVQDTKASITTAGGHVLKAMSKWTLTKYVTYAEYNVLQINIQDKAGKQCNDITQEKARLISGEQAIQGSSSDGWMDQLKW